MTHTYSIGKMLEIKDKNIKLDDKITEEETDKGRRTVFYGTLTYTPKGCMKCGIVNHSHADIVKNGTKISTIKLGQYNFKLVVSIAADFYQQCGSFYHSLQKNLPQFAVHLTN